jgi:hypothetical protein
MMPAQHAAIRMTSPGMRRLFVLSCVLVAIMGMPLFFWPTETERNFAWTIRPPVTAAFLGAGYWASFWIVLLALRERVWARARIGLWFAVAFAWITLAATLLHIDRFHLGEQFSPAARIMTWMWLAVYIAVPLIQLALIVRLRKQPGSDPPVESAMPAWYRAVIGALGAVLALLGLALFIAPATVAGVVWPWALTPLTARATGAWLVAWGVVAGQVALEADWRRVRAGLAGLGALGALQLVVLARFGAALSWGGIRPWVFTVAAIVLLALALIGLPRARAGH